MQSSGTPAHRLQQALSQHPRACALPPYPAALPPAKQEAERKTRKDRNREARRREAEEAAAAQRALKAQRRELSELKRLQAEVEAEEAAKGEARLRRQVRALRCRSDQQRRAARF